MLEDRIVVIHSGLCSLVDLTYAIGAYRRCRRRDDENRKNI